MYTHSNFKFNIGDWEFFANRTGMPWTTEVFDDGNVLLFTIDRLLDEEECEMFAKVWIAGYHRGEMGSIPF